MASLLATLLASCTSAGDTSMKVDAPGYNANGAAALSAVDLEAGSAEPAAQSDETAFAGGDQRQAAEQLRSQAALQPSPRDAGAAGIKQATDATPAQLAAATPSALIDGNKREFLSSFLGKPGAASPLAASATKPMIGANGVPLGAAARANNGGQNNGDKNSGRKLVQLASVQAGDGNKLASHLYDGDALPGVRQTMLFEIRRKSGIDDESDVDLNEEDGDGSFKVASAAGMARLAPNGLLKQNDTVDTACLKPGLVSILRNAEQHFGQKAVITSGYRDPAHNRRVQGAKKSLHMACAAADVQMAGVSRWELASYFRSMPGRGGVGTYCHTASVHVDVGPERDWNWKCGRRG